VPEAAVEVGEEPDKLQASCTIARRLLARISLNKTVFLNIELLSFLSMNYKYNSTLSGLVSLLSIGLLLGLNKKNTGLHNSARVSQCLCRLQSSAALFAQGL
jgi:hypothetical protein